MLRRRRSGPSRLARALNPLAAATSAAAAGDPLEEAVRVVGEYRPALRDKRISWFGWRLRDDASRRYVAVGFAADEELGLAEGRGHVVDVLTGHVLWEASIAGRRELPRTVAELGRR